MSPRKGAFAWGTCLGIGASIIVAYGASNMPPQRTTMPLAIDNLPVTAVERHERSGAVEETPAPTATPTPIPEAEPSLPPCATEDSSDCYWDADTMGNGQGRSFVNIGGTITYTDEKGPSAPTPTAEPEVQWHPMDEGTLICGPDAKPALDYNPHNGYGWWAYCEPALVMP